MIKLENVSKYYHSEGIFTLGLRKINLEFHIGEFVAITGESGSGKSTLLNVISGIDTYEEGELYINGEETSHYDEEDWENYRKNKVAFIFQNYNLIDSYTVLKNVEVVLLNQGYNFKSRRKKAKEILNRVGLSKHLRHRASKLSGGEKQRLAIARALAKNSDIIIADEPTGNLDSESGKQVLALLHEVASDKLVLIVTHNYAQAENYVTRKIRLFDGEVVEDKEIKPYVPAEPQVHIPNKMQEWKKSAIVTFFNLFGQPKKSVFLFLVSFSTVMFVFLLYGSLLRIDETIQSVDYYSSLYNIYTERVIVVRKDRKPLTQNDYDKLSKIPNVRRVIKEDVVLDISFHLNDSSINEYLAFDGFPIFLDNYNPDKLLGRLPQASDEILICAYFPEEEIPYLDSYLDRDYIFNIQIKSAEKDKKYKLVGIYNWTALQSNCVLTESEFANLYEELGNPDQTEGYPQFTINLKKTRDADDVLNRLYNEDYYGFSPYLTNSNYGTTLSQALLKLFYTAILGFSMFVIYLLSYLVYRALLNSKVHDYTILRIIGFQNKNIKQIILMEIFASFIFAYLSFVLVYQYIRIRYPVMNVYEWLDYIIIGLINLLLAFLITRKFINYQKGRSLFSVLKIGG